MKPWLPSARDLRLLKGWACGTTTTVTDMAGYLDAPEADVRRIVRENGWRS